jgi:hypothetical protein
VYGYVTNCTADQLIPLIDYPKYIMDNGLKYKCQGCKINIYDKNNSITITNYQSIYMGQIKFKKNKLYTLSNETKIFNNKSYNEIIYEMAIWLCNALKQFLIIPREIYIHITVILKDTNKLSSNFIFSNKYVRPERYWTVNKYSPTNELDLLFKLTVP